LLPLAVHVSIGPPTTYQPRWDTWGRLTAPLFSHVPFVGISGNHEQEPQSDGTRFASYFARYPTPAKRSGSPSPLFYSFEVAGVHAIVLSPYTDFGRGSAQDK
jgi:acid phosphatase type 7